MSALRISTRIPRPFLLPLLTLSAVLLSAWLSPPADHANRSGLTLDGSPRRTPAGEPGALHSQQPPKPGSPVACDAHLSLDFDSPVTAGSISVATEQDCYTFDAAAGDEVRVVVNEAAGPLSLQWEIQDSGTNTVCGPSLSVEQDCLMPSTGTYTLWLGDYFNTNTGGYRLKLLRLNSPVGCASTPLGLSFTSSVTSGSIGAQLEHDCYTFDAAAGDKVRVVVNEATGPLSLQWEIQDSSTNTVCGPSLSVEQDCFLPSTGSYTLIAWDYFNANTGGYRLKLLRLNSPLGCSPTPLALSFTSPATSGSIGTQLEHDCYTFDGAAGDKVRVVANEAAGSLSLQWAILDSDTNIVCGPSLSLEQDCFLPSMGSYTLIAWDYFNANTGGYRLKLLRLNDPVGCTPIWFNVPLAGFIGAQLEHDCYTFRSIAKDKVRLVADETGGPLSLQWVIQDSATNTVCGPTLAAEQDCSMPNSDTYTLIMWDYFNNNTGGYNVNLICLSCPNSADLSLTKSDGPDPVLVGNSLTYQLSVNNNGSLKATGVTLTDTLPSGATFVSAVSSQGVCTQASGKVTCDLGDVANGAKATATIVVTPTATGLITNNALVEADELDPDHSDNMATAVTRVTAPGEDYPLYLPLLTKAP